MRGVWISLLALVLAATVQAEDFKGQKVTLGKKKCTCDFTLDMKTKCKGSAKCDKRCTGKGTVEVGGCSFSLLVKKGGKGTISKCACAAQPTEAPAPAPTGTGSGSGSGSGETPVPITGSGSGGSGSEPMPPTGGSGSGAPPAGGEGMQCACKCDCPDGAGECDCDCNCPMTSKAVTCSPGFSKVCPMTDGQCPMDMEMMCPKGAMSRMASGGQGSDKGCQCVPDFLISLVMPSAAGRSLDRASGKVNIKIGKKTCKCSYGIVEANCKKSKFTCDKKCSGKATGVELEDGMYVMDLIIRKGKVTIAKCDKEEGPAPTGPGTGGSGNGGEGSGSGNGGEGTGASRCACVSKGMGGTGPSPPTGSGSGSGPAPPTGSGSGSGPAPPTGSGSGSEPGSGSGSGPETTLYRADLSSYSEALCNDGTAATYYYSGNINTSTKLLLYQQGGGACRTKEECKWRCTSQDSAFRCTTSTNETLEQTYTFWSNNEEINPPFHNFAKVFMHYCSSDAWVGSRDASEDTGGYHFHGRDIIRAVLDDLISTKINIDEMEQVVLLGTSAGAIGVQSVCDSVAERFKDGRDDLDVRCIADSGDLVPTIGQDCNTEEEAEAGLAFYGVELDSSCTESVLKCQAFFSSYQYIDTPLMVVHNYIDPVVLGSCAPELSNENLNYWNTWMHQVYQLSLQFIQDKPSNGLFVPRCFFHVLSKNDNGWGVIEVPLVDSNETILLKDIINNWLSGVGLFHAIDNPTEQNTFCSGGSMG